MCLHDKQSYGYNPRIVLLEANDDEDHNLCIHRNPITGLYGSNSKSRVGLDGRAASYSSLNELVLSYFEEYGAYGTLETNNSLGETSSEIIGSLMGYSQEIDLTDQYGYGWMDSQKPLWKMYFTYIDSRVNFYPLLLGDNNSPAVPHLHPFINALKHNYIGTDWLGRGKVRVENLPELARELYHIYLAEKGIGTFAPEIIFSFYNLIGIMPGHLENLAKYDLPQLRRSGYKPRLD